MSESIAERVERVTKLVEGLTTEEELTLEEKMVRKEVLTLLQTLSPLLRMPVVSAFHAMPLESLLQLSLAKTLVLRGAVNEEVLADSLEVVNATLRGEGITGKPVSSPSLQVKLLAKAAGLELVRSSLHASLPVVPATRELAEQLQALVVMAVDRPPGYGGLISDYIVKYDPETEWMGTSSVMRELMEGARIFGLRMFKLAVMIAVRDGLPGPTESPSASKTVG
jgi:hypothetical protein